MKSTQFVMCRSLVFGAALALAAIACTAAPARANTFVVSSLPNASVALDPSSTLDLEQARSTLSFVPPETLANPGLASPIRPEIVWFRFSPPVAPGRRYLEVAPRAGRAELFYVPPGATAYQPIAFGMREPFAQRRIARVPPTIELPSYDPAKPLYLRIALDDESSLVPLVSLLTMEQLRAENASIARLASASLLFIGIFISLAIANLSVFAFVRERSYAIYTAWMIGNAVFAATYLHGSAWAWLWPHASFADGATQGTVVLVEAIFLLAFARSFLKTRALIPRTDRLVTRACCALVVVGAATTYVIPSIRIAPGLDGRDVFLFSTMAFLVLVFALSIVALRVGSIPARFFAISNGLVSVSAVSVAFTNLSRHDVGGSANFVGLMIGQSLEGWFLFAALAYRLRQTTRDFNAEQQRRIDAQAESLAQARSLLAQRELAATDALTGMPNRRSFDEVLAREWERCARSATPLSLLMVDVDYFKGFNDAYGHVLGDDCLRRVSRAIAQCATRPGDRAARYGGEEFAVVLPETGPDAAAEIAEEMVHAVRALDIAHKGSSYGHVTISVGVATVVPEPGAEESIVVIADDALYRAKREGRDRFAEAQQRGALALKNPQEGSTTL
jgi:diguanylate cyclase (GGDEF)-like protein